MGYRGCGRLQGLKMLLGGVRGNAPVPLLTQQGAGGLRGHPRLWAQGCDAGVRAGAQMCCWDMQGGHGRGRGGCGRGEARRLARVGVVGAN